MNLLIFIDEAMWLFKLFFLIATMPEEYLYI